MESKLVQDSIQTASEPISEGSIENIEQLHKELVESTKAIRDECEEVLEKFYQKYMNVKR